MKIIRSFLLILMLQLAVCDLLAQNVIQQNISPFQLPEIPDTMVSIDERANYLALHFWDNFNFKDTALIHKPEVSEQALVDFTDFMNRIDPAVAESAISKTIKLATTNKMMLSWFWDTFSKYMYSINSPMRNENLYIMTCRAIGKNYLENDSISLQAAYRLESAMKNRTGRKASDFIYTLPSGDSAGMYSVTSPYLILFFYNPECETCTIAKEEMSSSLLLNKLQVDGKLKILAIYPDEDLNIWSSYQSCIPSSWINSYDKMQEIHNNHIYHLRTMPTIYLLDENKVVILKDADIARVENYLQNK